MIDIETLDNKVSSAITSIAAIVFDIETGEIGEKFRVNVNAQSCLDLGMTVSYETLHWWLNTPEQVTVLKSFTIDMKNISEALHLLTQFIQKHKPSELRVWGNSNRFDLGILAYAYQKCNKPHPWQFYLERDVRTLVDLAPKFKEEELSARPTTHDPTEDTLAQIRYVVATYNHLKIWYND